MGLWLLYLVAVQSWAFRWALGCVRAPSAATGSQEAGFTQPRAHLKAHLCTNLDEGEAIGVIQISVKKHADLAKQDPGWAGQNR